MRLGGAVVPGVEVEVRASMGEVEGRVRIVFDLRRGEIYVQSSVEFEG